MVMVLTGCPGPAGSQMCHVGPSLLTSLKVKLGSCCKVTCGDASFLCHVWPRQDNCEKYIQMDSVVSSNVKSEVSQCEASVEGVDSTDANILNVSVVVDDHSMAVRYKHNLAVQSKVKTQVLNLLRNMSVANGYVVRIHKMELGKLYGISFIVVSGVLETDCSIKVLAVKKSTQVVIDNVVSKERFLQQTNRKRTVLGGLGGPLRSLKSVAELAFFKSEHLRRLGVDVSRGIMLRGPPGCGKTSLVHLLVEEFEAHLICLDAGAAYGSRPGETEEMLRKAFQKAVDMSQEGPCIVFLDEVDALCPQRGGRGSQPTEGRVVSQLASLLDGLHSQSGVLVVGATNRPSAVDSSLRRTGRLEKEIFIGIPSLQQRRDILSTLTSDLKLSPDVSLAELAEATPGYVGADLLALVQHALSSALGDKQKDIVPNMRHFSDALHNVSPSTQRGSDILVEYRPVSWSEIGGLEEVKTQIQQAVEWPLKHPEAFSRLGIQRPRGVLLYGPPGCAKTLLVRAAATSCHVTFLAISGAQLYSPFVGDSERKISEVFQQARAGAPAVLFIDEIDSVIGSRSRDSKQSSVQQRVLSTLLNEMDGVGMKVNEMQRSTQLLAAGDTGTQPGVSTEEVDNSDVLVVAATNRPDMLDDALMRPGRFDRIIYVPPPDEKARQQILEVHTKRTPLDDVDLGSVAKVTEGFTGADLENLCREAALHSLTNTGLHATTIGHEDFLAVLGRLKPSLTPEQLLQYTSHKYTRR